MKQNKLVPKLRFKEFNGGWVENKLEKICVKTISYGIVQTGENIADGVPCVRVVDLTAQDLDVSRMIRTTQEISDSYSKTVLEKNEIMLALRGEIGLVKIVRDNLVGANLTRGVARISVNSPYQPEYILWLLQSRASVAEIGKRVNGSALKEIPLSGLRKISLYLSPFKTEQQKIASFLSAVDEKIQQLTRKKELLEQYKNGVMQQFFSRKLRFKDEKGNDYPEWKEKKLGEVCESIKSGKSKPYDDGSFPLYGSTGIIGKCEEYSHDGLYILIARVGANAGTINLVKDRFGVSDNTLVVICNESDLVTEYLYFYLEFFNLNKLIFGSGQPLITGGQLKELKLEFPCLEEQNKIAFHLACIASKIENIVSQITQTQTFKKGLLLQMFV